MRYLLLVTLALLAAAPDMARAAAAVVRPIERLKPHEFAARHRHLLEGTTSKPGPWSNDVFPYLTPIMDAVEEAIRTGKRGLVLMKSGQGGGSEAMINAFCWAKVNYPGPMLYLISKDDLAREFGRERFGHIDRTCEPMARIALRGRANGEAIQTRRYTTGKIVIQGGRSVLNLQTTPYRFVWIDEVDSLLAEIEGQGDPIKLAEIRTDAFPGDTLIVAFAHPTIREHGAGKLYYELSDQRRGYVPCPHCADWFWLRWDDVRVEPHDGQSRDAATRDPSAYVYRTPCCDGVLSDGQRYAAVRRVEQRSTLKPEEAARRPWLGVHFSQLYMSNKPLRYLAEKAIEGLDDPATERVFVNKRLGDVYESKVAETTTDQWRLLVEHPRGDAPPRRLGDVPPQVSFLTAGQDSRKRELHWCVWGWGLVQTAERHKLLCGWLIDYGVQEREGDDQALDTLEWTELEGLASSIYDRQFVRADGATLYTQLGYHDSGWQTPAVYEFCRRRAPRAVPVKGAPADATSALPLIAWRKVPPYRVGSVEVANPAGKVAAINTYQAKEAFLGLVGKRVEELDEATGEIHRSQPRLRLPVDVGDAWIEQAAAERKVSKKGKLIFQHRGPNHWGDCNIYAYVAALQLNPFQRNQTAKERAKVHRDRYPVAEPKKRSGWKIGR